MRRFAGLFAALDGTNATNAKVEAIAEYFAGAPPADAAWAVYFLLGRRLKRLVAGRALGQWALSATALPEWLLAESYAVVGDGAETAALLLDQLPPAEDGTDLSLSAWVEDRLLPLRHSPPDLQQALVLGWVRGLDRWQRFTLFKLLSGELRLGVSHTLVVRALAQVAGLPPATMAARLMGDWSPGAAWYAQLIAPEATAADRSRPYPFFLASPLDETVDGAAALAAALGDRADWLVEWKWDGIRAQLVKRDGRVALWSRGEELITTRFPEIAGAAAVLPDGTVLDGEVLAFRDGRPLPFSALQQRIGREREVARAARGVPVVFMTFDLVEHAGVDCREEPLAARRLRLEQIVAGAAARPVRLEPEAAAPPRLPLDDQGRGGAAGSIAGAVLLASPLVDAPDWTALAGLRGESRDRGVEGLMLKRLTSPYGVGRRRGDWWKWKIDPHVIDAVLIYAQPGSGKRASLLTDYTFGLWHEGALVPVAKAYSGLSNDEIAEMDRWIRRHTVERFGPVRHVEPVQVMELGFEAVARSSRHRSGVAVRFPRMRRWRRDKQASDADTLEALLRLVPGA
jgi:DNA ligase-1